ncbi:MAG TPA: hypothetical protein VGS19_30600 [Streptosporangiaceae bacterium]|nr:hypothetical protein [Streptosporangiaceae bacterium]
MTLPAYTGTLTPDHRQFITGIRDRWMATVLSTAPVDRAATAEAVRCLYDTHKLPQPSLIIWMDSPLGCVYAAAAIGRLGDQFRRQLLSQLRQQLHDQLGGRLWARLAGQIWGQLGNRLGDWLRDPLRRQLEDQLNGQLQHQLWGQLRGQIRGQLQGQLWDQLKGQLWDQFWDQLGGQSRIQLGDEFDEFDGQDEDRDWDDWDEHLFSLFPWKDAYALAFYGCALTIAGRPADPGLGALSSVVTETGWLIPMRGVVIAGARPAVLHHDARGDLHNPVGMAVAYPDGWGFHAWHGRPVPDWVVIAPCIEAITAEENTEVRRCAIESLGWDRFIAQAGLAPVTAGDSKSLAAAHVPDPGNPGQHLVLYDVPERLWGSRIRLLMCTNGTPERDGTRRRYALAVPAHISDPVEAAAWTAGLRKDQYAQMVRRT